MAATSGDQGQMTVEFRQKPIFVTRPCVSGLTNLLPAAGQPVVVVRSAQVWLSPGR